MKLLTICIPTYKRSKTLFRCIESITLQVDKYDLSNLVDIYIADDASPDDTLDVINKFSSLKYFKAITRKDNLGMNVNIKTMLSELKENSEYQLVITDDDYLQPDILNEIIGFLKEMSNTGISAIWTPRYSYTEDNELHTIACNPFNQNMFVKPSVYNVGKYMNNGFVLSGLIIRAKDIDYDFWEKYQENAYFPILFFGDILLRNGAYYWDKNIVHHTVLNECHWERWGKNKAIIDFRLFSDYANAYSIMGEHINNRLKFFQFFYSSYQDIRRVLVRLTTGKLRKNRNELSEAIDELKRKKYLKFENKIKILMIFALTLSTSVSFIKIIITKILKLITLKSEKIEHYNKRMKLNYEMLSSTPELIKIVLF